VYSYDHQGQGFSERWIADSTSTWIQSFDDYCDDFAFYVTTICRESSLPVFAIAHSLGGLILSITMSRNPTLVTRAVLTAPMFRSKFYVWLFEYWVAIPEPIVMWLTSLLCYSGFGSFRAFGFLNDSSSDRNTMDSNNKQVMTSDELHMQSYKSLKQKYPHMVSTGVTNDWVRLCIVAQRKFSRRYKFVKTNTLSLCAASDAFVHNRAIIEFAKQAAACKLFIAPCFHDILFETSDIKQSATNTILDFFQQPEDNVNVIKAKDPFFLVNPSMVHLSFTEKVVRGTGLVMAAIGGLVGVSLLVGGPSR
jgi:lysophospholipase